MVEVAQRGVQDGGQTVTGRRISGSVLRPLRSLSQLPRLLGGDVLVAAVHDAHGLGDTCLEPRALQALPDLGERCVDLLVLTGSARCDA